MKAIRCENCGTLLFRVNDDGLIQHNGGWVRQIDGVCECGHGFHYSVTERLLKRIIKRYNQRADDGGAKVNKWISVKDRMPAYDSSNPYKSYLVCDANEGDCTVARREDPKYKDWSFQADLWQSEFVTHWMPLPELPEVDG